MSAKGNEKAKELRFVHVTKCAGTSIEEISGGVWGRHDTSYRDAVAHIPTQDFSWWHIPLMYAQHGQPAYVLKDLLKRFDYFCVVRNPFDRIVSEYFCPWGGPKVKAKTQAEFNKWIATRLRSLQVQMAALDRYTAAERSGSSSSGGGSGGGWDASHILQGHWIPQYLYTIDLSGATIIPPERVLRFEQLASTGAGTGTGAEAAGALETLVRNYPRQKHLTLRAPAPGPAPASASATTTTTTASQPVLVHRNNGEAAKTFTAADLSAEVVALARAVYAQDFARFGYALEVPQPQPRPPRLLAVAAAADRKEGQGQGKGDGGGGKHEREERLEGEGEGEEEGDGAAEAGGKRLKTAHAPPPPPPAPPRTITPAPTSTAPAAAAAAAAPSAPAFAPAPFKRKKMSMADMLDTYRGGR